MSPRHCPSSCRARRVQGPARPRTPGLAAGAASGRAAGHGTHPGERGLRPGHGHSARLGALDSCCSEPAADVRAQGHLMTLNCGRVFYVLKWKSEAAPPLLSSHLPPRRATRERAPGPRLRTPRRPQTRPERAPGRWSQTVQCKGAENHFIEKLSCKYASLKNVTNYATRSHLFGQSFCAGCVQRTLTTHAGGEAAPEGVPPGPLMIKAPPEHRPGIFKIRRA